MHFSVPVIQSQANDQEVSCATTCSDLFAEDHCTLHTCIRRLCYQILIRDLKRSHKVEMIVSPFHSLQQKDSTSVHVRPFPSGS